MPYISVFLFSGWWAWGYYYMVTVMGDYSWSILAWKLQLDMTFDPGGPDGHRRHWYDRNTLGGPDQTAE